MSLNVARESVHGTQSASWPSWPVPPQTPSHTALTEWLCDGPTSTGFGREVDDRVTQTANAVAVLRHELDEVAFHSVSELRAARSLVTDVLREGLERRAGERHELLYPDEFDPFSTPDDLPLPATRAEIIDWHEQHATPAGERLELRAGFHLSDAERQFVAELGKLAAAGTKLAPNLNGVRGLRACNECGLVFRAPRARVCAHCRRNHGRASERPVDIAKRRRHRGRDERAAWNLVDNKLTTDLISRPAAAVLLGVCEWCDEPFELTQSNKRFCSNAHRQAAYRDRKLLRSSTERRP